MKISDKLQTNKRLVFLSYVPDVYGGAMRGLAAFTEQLRPLKKDLRRIPLDLKTSDEVAKPGEVTRSAREKLLREITDFLALISPAYLLANDPSTSGRGEEGELALVLDFKRQEMRADVESEDNLTIWLAPIDPIPFDLSSPGGIDPCERPYSKWWHPLAPADDYFRTDSNQPETLRAAVAKALKILLSHPTQCTVCVVQVEGQS